MPRLFTGLEIPPDLARRLALLQGGLPGAHWIAQENLHLTLRFVGDVDARTAAEITAALAAIERPAFTLQVRGLAAFGGRRPRAIYAGVTASYPLSDLLADQERRLQRLGLAPEGRRFTPHVTLARLRNVRPRVAADYLALRGDFASEPFTVARFVLFSARQSVGGGPYVAEEVYPLQTGDGAGE